jgi:hypothetical protein
MEVDLDLSPETEKKLNERAAQRGMTPHKYVLSLLQEHFDELARTEALLDGRYDELKSGAVKPIPGDDVASYFREKSAAMRDLKPAA